METIGVSELERYRAMSIETILPRLADYVKSDASFIPIRDKHTHRFHVRANGQEFEILSTGPKFFDTRQKRGGGGAIDLVMHLHQLGFKQAINKLRQVL